jgi:CHAT domain-containing protein
MLEMTKFANYQAKRADFRTLLRDLWDIVVRPVIAVLQDDLYLPKGSRIWWCPTGPASHLPLHAAGDYGKGGRCAPNIYISSYTTTLSSLIKARQTHRHPSYLNVVPRLLVVGQPGIGEEDKLFSVAEELQILKQRFPSVTILEGMAATRDAVITNISLYEWLHLTCHGHVDLREPFKSRFSLADGTLSLGEVLRNSLPQSRLAFLSACLSAAGNQERSDEALHLVAGLQFSGYQSAVGTMWEMADSTGMTVTKVFWSEMLRFQAANPGLDVTNMSARALHYAVTMLRKEKTELVDWACFVHHGC